MNGRGRCGLGRDSARRPICRRRPREQQFRRQRSGQPVGTHIGTNFGLCHQGNLSAAYGTPVGQIGGGDCFVIGTAYDGVAAASSTLSLSYWDSNNNDSFGGITANATAAVPEPETEALLLAGLGVVGLVARCRRA